MNNPKQIASTTNLAFIARIEAFGLLGGEGGGGRRILPNFNLKNIITTYTQTIFYGKNDPNSSNFEKKFPIGN